VDFFFVLFYVCTAVVFSLNIAEIPLKVALNSNQSINQLYWDRPFTSKPLQIPILSVLYKSSNEAMKS